ncbi:uncharacterized protein [Solanum lycopersicum]|uniref:uncharacterized protein isoform X2 n=1 Tax=Solanum lycopersicum TaxID=4081 RepID=UPI000532B963|nr:uncharacterized protein LOC101259997 isoform X2 [Solanum lycopersicum]
MEAEAALELVKHGATLLLLDVPQNTLIGIDTQMFFSGPNFKGVKMIPPGVHFIYYSSSNREGNEFSPIVGFFVEASPSEVIVKKWDSKDERFVKLSEEEGERYAQAVKKLEFDRQLGPYALDQYGDWKRLSNFITKSTIGRIEPVGGEITIISESEMVGNVHKTAMEKVLAEQLKSSKFSKPDKKSPSNSCYYTSIPRVIKLKGVSGQDLTNMNLDKTHILETILTKQYGGSEDSLLGELQFAFVAFLMGQSLEAFLQWKLLVSLLLGCTEAPLHTRTQLFTKVKAEHLRPGGEFQGLPIPEWKWDRITMDFVAGLPRTSRGFDSIWVIVDRLTKSAHFLFVQSSFSAERLARIYIREVVRLHGVPVSIISDRGSQFTSSFWRTFQDELGTQVDLSTAFHPQTDGQSERTIQVLEDMLRACVLEFGGQWDQFLPLAEFAYNNSYNSSIQMAPFEALYGRRCRTPVGWFESTEPRPRGTDLIQEALEQVRVIQDRLRTAQSRHQSYANRRHRPLRSSVGDRVFLRVSPMKGVMRFGRRGKLSPRYIGPFEILRTVGEVTYELALPPAFSAIHPVFHVSMLRRYIPDESHVLQYDAIELDDHLTFVEEPVAILARDVRKLRSRAIPIVKVRWRHRSVEEATWETEQEMREQFPGLFEPSGPSTSSQR